MLTLKLGPSLLYALCLKLLFLYSIVHLQGEVCPQA